MGASSVFIEAMPSVSPGLVAPRHRDKDAVMMVMMVVVMMMVVAGSHVAWRNHANVAVVVMVVMVMMVILSELNRLLGHICCEAGIIRLQHIQSVRNRFEKITVARRRRGLRCWSGLCGVHCG